MDILKKLFSKRKSSINDNTNNITEAEKNQKEEILNVSLSVETDSQIKTGLRIPLWQSIPSEENREIDQNNGIDYKKVRIIFNDGNIQDVTPDVNNYYLAEIYCINGEDYNITNIESINKIPLPSKKSDPSSGSVGTPVYRLEYLLRIRAGMAKDEGNKELAYALMDKGTKLLKYSRLDWMRHDYLREYYWLLDDDRIEDAKKFFTEIEPDLPEPYSDKERIKEIQHYNYAMLKRNFPQEMPKSFSAYMRNYNKKDAKYNKFVKLAESINIKIV